MGPSMGSIQESNPSPNKRMNSKSIHSMSASSGDSNEMMPFLNLQHSHTPSIQQLVPDYSLEPEDTPPIGISRTPSNPGSLRISTSAKLCTINDSQPQLPRALSSPASTTNNTPVPALAIKRKKSKKEKHRILSKAETFPRRERKSYFEIMFRPNI